MDEDVFVETQDRIRDFNLSKIHTIEEWNSFFADGIALLEHPDEQLKRYSIERMSTGIRSEPDQRYNQPDFQPLANSKRIVPILDALVKQDPSKQFILRFTAWGLFSVDQKEVISSWLTTAEADGSLTKDTVAIARIQSRLHPSSDWKLAKPFLEPLFDHPNDLLRAAAAAAMGEMFVDSAENMPVLSEVMEQVKNWEIVRPGFAGPFLGQLLMADGDDGEIENSGVKLADWILEIIEKRQTDEPCVPFYNSINFHALEILCGNPIAIGKLIDLGEEMVAAESATEVSRPIAGMQELLEKLANSSDDFIARICSWHLAYNYRCLHAEGLRRGYVRREERDDVEIFLVFNPEEDGQLPYAATIYPRDSFLSDEAAWHWSDKLIPPTQRPPIEIDEPPPGVAEENPESISFKYGGYIIEMIGACESKQWDRVWIKWPLQSSEW